MSSEIKADKWSPASGTSATIGDSGDTYTVPTGANFTVTDELKTNKISPASGTAFTMGDSGDTFTIPSGATITNSGTATGFGGNTPQFMVAKTSSQSISNNSATKVTWDSELVDSDNTFASDKFTVPAGGGTYLIFSTLLMDSKNNSDLKNCYIKLYKNGSLLQQHVYDFRSNQPRRMAIDLTGVHTLSATDYLEMYAQIDSDDGDVEVDGASSGDGYLTIFGGIKV